MAAGRGGSTVPDECSVKRMHGLQLSPQMHTQFDYSRRTVN
jgi:hypothetical protein